MYVLIQSTVKIRRGTDCHRPVVIHLAEACLPTSGFHTPTVCETSLRLKAKLIREEPLLNALNTPFGIIIPLNYSSRTMSTCSRQGSKTGSRTHLLHKKPDNYYVESILITKKDVVVRSSISIVPDFHNQSYT